MVPFHIMPLVHQPSPYWKFIPLNFQVASPRSFSICLRIHIPGKRCDVWFMSRSGRRAWPQADQHQWEKAHHLAQESISPCGTWEEQMAEDPGKGSPRKSEDGLSSVQISHSVMSDSLRPRGLQHSRLPCPSPTPRVYSNSCPSSWQCHPTISSSIVPFSSCLQSFPASGSLPISRLFASGGQSTGVSASTSVLPKYIQDWFPLGWTGWISL